MNKYQEAVEYLTSLEYNRNNDYPEGSVRWEVVNSCNNVYNSLQELVDRATPMKPVDVLNQYNCIDSSCKKCGVRIANRHSDKYCNHCGQAIDWSDEQ